MAEPDSRELLLSSAKALILERGYAATTVDAICEAAGLTKGSFYHFYKSKEALGLAVLEWSIAQSTKLLSDGPYVRIKDPVERALGYLDHVEKCSGQLWSGGCILGSFALELADTNERMQKAVARIFNDVAASLAEVFKPIVEASGQSFSPQDLAEQYLGTLEGAIILAKAHHDWTRIPKALRGFRQYLASYLPQPV
jgi:TetR/AcrR family transcriptional repressor of nem operon